jgi:hypothetical protein
MRLRELAESVPGAVTRPAKRAALLPARIANRGTMPDALIIGAQRAGSTSLYDHLTQHPGVKGARMTKEVHFFDAAWDRGVGYYAKFFPSQRARDRFSTRHGYDLVALDATPYYMFNPHCPGRVASLIPEARLIAVLRNPIDRAFSHYKHEVATGFETSASFEEAIDREDERLEGEVERMMSDETYRSVAHQHFSYLSRGRYDEQLARWFDLFAADRVLILVSEELFRDADPAMRQVYRFLDLPDHASGPFPASNASTGGSKLLPQTRARLREYFAEPNRRLYDTLGRDLGWG